MLERRRTSSTPVLEGLALLALGAASVAGALVAAGQTGTGLI